MIATRPECLKSVSVRQVVRYFTLILRLLDTISLLLETKREIEGLSP